MFLESCRVKALVVYLIGAVLAMGSLGFSEYLHSKVSFRSAEWITYVIVAASFLCCVLPPALWGKASLWRILLTLSAIVSWPLWLIPAVAINILLCGGKAPDFH